MVKKSRKSKKVTEEIEIPKPAVKDGFMLNESRAPKREKKKDSSGVENKDFIRVIPEPIVVKTPDPAKPKVPDMMKIGVSDIRRPLSSAAPSVTHPPVSPPVPIRPLVSRRFVAILFDRMATKDNPCGDRLIWDTQTNRAFLGGNPGVGSLIVKGFIPVQNPSTKSAPTAKGRRDRWLKDNCVTFMKFEIQASDITE